jgi:hypothetical protein
VWVSVWGEGGRGGGGEGVVNALGRVGMDGGQGDRRSNVWRVVPVTPPTCTFENAVPFVLTNTTVWEAKT